MTEEKEVLTIRERVILKTVSDWVFDRKIIELQREGVREDPDVLVAEALEDLKVLLERITQAIRGMESAN